MSRHACFAALAALAAVACAEQSAVAPLDDEQLRAAEFAGGFSVPSPAEMYAAFDKLGKPDWSVHVRRQPVAAHTSRPIIALNLGVSLADGFLTAEIQDRQQVKNVLQEIKLLAKSLGLEQELTGRSNSIGAFADNRQWSALQEELEAVQGELCGAMEGRHDGELATLMLLGCWLRTVNIASAHLSTANATGGAGIIRQTALWDYFATRLEMLPPKLKTLPVIIEIQRSLPALRDALALSAGGPPAGSGSSPKPHLMTSDLIAVISAPEK